MAIRSNHYEAAFEAYIRALRVPCVAIDEARRAIFGEDGVKNPDFCCILDSRPTWWWR